MQKIRWRIIRWGQLSTNPESMTDDERDLLLELTVAQGTSSQPDFASTARSFSDNGSEFDRLVGGNATPLNGVIWHYVLQVKQGHLLSASWTEFRPKQIHRAPVVELRKGVKR